MKKKNKRIKFRQQMFLLLFHSVYAVALLPDIVDEDWSRHHRQWMFFVPKTRVWQRIYETFFSLAQKIQIRKALKFSAQTTDSFPPGR